MKPSELKQFERTFCDCSACCAVCRVQPGALAPGDFDQILASVGKECDDLPYVYGHFVADHDAKTKTPLIRPAQHQDGRCVFLQADGRCSVYRVAPFGCTRQNACEPFHTDAMHALHDAITASLDYQWTWEELASNGQACPSHEQRAAWFAALNENQAHDDIDNQEDDQ